MNKPAPPADDAAKSDNPPKPTGKSSTALAIRIVLLVVLGLLVVGLIYDYWVARPAHKKAWDDIQVMLQSKNTDAGVVKITNKEVQEKFGRAPSSTYKDGRFTVEVFSWRTGLLVTSYPIYVYYEGEDPLRLALANPSEPIEDLDRLDGVKIPPVEADADASPEPPEDSGVAPPDGDGTVPPADPPADGEPTPVDEDAGEPMPEPASDDAGDGAAEAEEPASDAAE